MKQGVSLNRGNWRRIAATLPFSFGALLSAHGQVLPLHSAAQLEVPNAFRLIDADRAASSLTPGSPLYVNPNSFLQWGSVAAHPHLTSALTYGNNLLARPGDTARTLIEEVSPGVLFELGSKWRLDYTPTLTYYGSKEFQDTLAQSVSLGGGTTYGTWAFGLAQSYSITSQPLIETGLQTTQESFGTSITAAHHFESKLMLELGINQNFSAAEALTSSHNWSTMDWLNYQILPRISIGVGMGGGYESLNLGSDTANEQLQGRLDVRILEKLSVSINMGGESRQIIDSDGDPLINPIYGASILYRPFEFTTLSLSGSRAVAASLLPGQITETTGISLALNQRLLGQLNLTLSGGFNNNRYIAADSTLALNREDDTTTFAARLGYGFMKHGTISIFYSRSDNSSTEGSFGLSSSQVGLQIGYQF